MWHDFKILLRELTTTTYGSTMQEVHDSVERHTRQHPATDNVDALVEPTQQLIQQSTTPWTTIDGSMLHKGELNKGSTDKEKRL